MNQFVIDMTAHQPSLRSGYPVSGDNRMPTGGRAVPVRAAWPFLVSASRRADKQAPQQQSGGSSGFAS